MSAAMPFPAIGGSSGGAYPASMLNKYLHVGAAALLPLCMACSTSAGGQDTPMAPVVDGSVNAVPIGTTAYVDGPQVTPLEVIEDSRCPVEVDCVWGGQVRLLVRVGLPSGTNTHEIGTNAPIDIADGQLRLVAVTPDQHVGVQIAPADYRFRFAFAGGI